MAENLIISKGDKEQKYSVLYPQIKALVENESDLIANMANISSMLHDTFGFWWTGFYRVCEIHGTEDSMLVLGPFQGPLACSRIRFGKGVCGTAWAQGETIIVPDVELFPGHIACSSASRSEIVVPIYKAEEVIAVLDIDSAEKNTFDQTDKDWLEKIAGLL
jgi:GAF domain-containing protein